MLPPFGEVNNNFATNTFPTKPVAPVTSIPFSLNHSGIDGLLVIVELSAKYYCTRYCEIIFFDVRYLSQSLETVMESQHNIQRGVGYPLFIICAIQLTDRNNKTIIDDREIEGQFN